MDVTALLNLTIAFLGGLAVGIERQWSGHAVGPRARFAGIRTFALLGLVAGLSGWLWTAGLQGPSVVVLAGAGALVVVAYLSASRRDIDGTTEVAAFVVLAAGVLAGAGYRAVASGIVALTALLLVEKRQLHRWVGTLDRQEVRAAARFAVMAAVILPILPPGPYGPADTIKPRLLWMMVLFFSGLSFLGYVIRRAAGADRGYVIAGALGGLLSSTSVTLTFSRLSKSHPSAGRALAAGTLGACVMLLPRILVATAVLAPALSVAIWPMFVAPAVVGALLALRGWQDPGTPARQSHDPNPLQFKAALEMAALFQVVLFAVAYATRHFGQQGVYGSAAVLGLADMDALTVSMAQLTTSGTDPAVTARAVTIGVLSNTFVKLTIVLAVGRGRFRLLGALGLALTAVALAMGLYWTR